MANSVDPVQKPTDPDLHCLHRQDISRFSRTRVKKAQLIIKKIYIISIRLLIIAQALPSTTTKTELTHLRQLYSSIVLSNCPISDLSSRQTSSSRAYVMNIQSTLVISNSKGLSEILRDIRSSTYQVCRIEEKIIWLTTFNKLIGNWTFEVRERYIENIVEKRRNCSLGAISPLFYNIFHLLLDFHV